VLKWRLISAAILVPLVIFGVLRMSTQAFAVILGVILVAASWEWSRLVPLTGFPARILYCAAITGLLALTWLGGPAELVIYLLVAAGCWWLFALYWLTHPGQCATASSPCIALKLLAGIMVSVPPWTALVVLHRLGEDGPLLTLLLLVMIWCADSGAYFAGHRWGRHKLAPLISPGKTREGVYGGLLVSLLVAGIAAWLYSQSPAWTLSFILVSLPAVLFSVVGDLLESLMKRQSGIKDSGSIIPGHGGIFDRIDSLVAAAPVFLAGFLWLKL
jgi:phosphatidate cytidylyltransferase